MISTVGVVMDADKVEVVCAGPTLRTIRAVRGFLGLTGYYQKSIHSYGDIIALLTPLLKRDSLHRSPEAATAFDELKSALTSALILQLSNFTKPFGVNYDVLGFDFGPVLHQGAGPLAFFSRAIAPHHAKHMAYEQELISLVKVVRHWRPYLWTRPFVIRTNHFSLKYLLD
jgi:hypothetical protein